MNDSALATAEVLDLPEPTDGRPAGKEPTEEERKKATTAIRRVSDDIKRRAQRLRLLSYFLLAAVVILLVAGLGVLFYSQILLITNSTEQANSIRRAEGGTSAGQTEARTAGSRI